MNINQSDSEKNLTFRQSNQTRPNYTILIISSLLLTTLTGYFIWREIQLNAAEKVIRDCTENHNCANKTKTLEKLVKAKKSLKLFNLEHLNLKAAHLEKANLKSANLEATNLENAHLEDAHLENANLSTARMIGAHLENANLENANLSNIHLENANLYRANLQGVHISHDHLQGAHLNRANLQGTRLYYADFEYTYFHLTNLSHTYFYRANFSHANLYRANLQGAQLIEAQNLTPAQIKSACNWETAIYKGVWSPKQSKWVVDHKANQQFIKQLQQDKESHPKKPVDCSEWD